MASLLRTPKKIIDGMYATSPHVAKLLDALEADYRLRKVRAWTQFKAHLRPIRAVFADQRVIEVTEEAVDSYIENRLAEGKAPATVNRETQLLGQAFRTKMAKRLNLSGPDIRHLSERDNSRQGYFEVGEFQALVPALPEDLQDFTRFGYLSGWRKGEIASLRWADVDREGQVIHLRAEASKSGKGRTLALAGELWAIIERRWAAREHTNPGGTVALAPCVFHRVGRPIGDFRKAWASACKAAGLEGKLFHDLRRTAIRNMVRAGVSERVSMDISGHRTRSVFDRYDITNERDLREAMQKTQAHLRALSPERTVLPLPRAQEGSAR